MSEHPFQHQRALNFGKELLVIMLFSQFPYQPQGITLDDTGGMDNPVYRSPFAFNQCYQLLHL